MPAPAQIRSESAPDKRDAASSITRRLAAQDDVALQQVRAGRDRRGALTGVRGLAHAALAPVAEVLVGLPVRHHEVAFVARHRPEQLEAQEPWGVVDRAQARAEALLQFGSRVLG